MINRSEVLSMISLLDDDDEEVSNLVEQKLLSLGVQIIPMLEDEWAHVSNFTQQQKIENIIHRIQFMGVLQDMKQWRDSEHQDLLDGVYLIAKSRYPDLDKQKLINEIDRIRLDIWLELRNELTAFEKVRIINHVLYTTHGFKGNTEQYHDPQNSFINSVLESKRGNPIMLAVVYMLIAQRLHLPVFGVNLPQHFVLAFKEDPPLTAISDSFNSKPTLDYQYGRVLFYINAFNQGSVFSKTNLEHFLRQINIEPRVEFFEACSNIDIVKRILRNLVVAYQKQNKQNKVNEVYEMLSLLGEPPLNDYIDTTPENGGFDD
ncbi:MAG: transglutaminase-like domain-containing protein [Bacteroidota bacterium]|jgi:regulator of sirC expression with transglutaminase-like and TPR domain